MSPVAVSSTASLTGWSPMSNEMSVHVAAFVTGSTTTSNTWPGVAGVVTL